MYKMSYSNDKANAANDMAQLVDDIQQLYLNTLHAIESYASVDTDPFNTQVSNDAPDSLFVRLPVEDYKSYCKLAEHVKDLNNQIEASHISKMLAESVRSPFQSNQEQYRLAFLDDESLTEEQLVSPLSGYRSRIQQCYAEREYYRIKVETLYSTTEIFERQLVIAKTENEKMMSANAVLRKSYIELQQRILDFRSAIAQKLRGGAKDMQELVSNISGILPQTDIHANKSDRIACNIADTTQGTVDRLTRDKVDLQEKVKYLNRKIFDLSTNFEEISEKHERQTAELKEFKFNLELANTKHSTALVQQEQLNKLNTETHQSKLDCLSSEYQSKINSLQSQLKIANSNVGTVNSNNNNACSVRTDSGKNSPSESLDENEKLLAGDLEKCLKRSNEENVVLKQNNEKLEFEYNELRSSVYQLVATSISIESALTNFTNERRKVPDPVTVKNLKVSLHSGSGDATSPKVAKRSKSNDPVLPSPATSTPARFNTIARTKLDFSAISSKLSPPDGAGLDFGASSPELCEQRINVEFVEGVSDALRAGATKILNALGSSAFVTTPCNSPRKSVSPDSVSENSSLAGISDELPRSELVSKYRDEIMLRQRQGKELHKSENAVKRSSQKVKTLCLKLEAERSKCVLLTKELSMLRSNTIELNHLEERRRLISGVEDALQDHSSSPEKSFVTASNLNSSVVQHVNADLLSQNRRLVEQCAFGERKWKEEECRLLGIQHNLESELVDLKERLENGMKVFGDKQNDYQAQIVKLVADLNVQKRAVEEMCAQHDQEIEQMIQSGGSLLSANTENSQPSPFGFPDNHGVTSSQQMVELNDQLRESQSKFQDAILREAVLITRIEELEKEVGLLERENIALRETGRQNDSMRNELDENRATYENHIDKLQQNITELEEDKSLMREQSSELRLQRADLQNKLEAFKADNREYADLKQKCEMLKGEISSLTQQLQAEKKMTTSTMQTLEEAKSMFQSSEHEVENLRSQLNFKVIESSGETERLRNDLTEAQTEVKRLTEEVHLSHSSNTLSHLLTVKSEQCDKLQDELVVSNQRLAAVKQVQMAYQQVQHQLKEKSEQLIKAVKLTDDVKEKLKIVENEKCELSKELKEFEEKAHDFETTLIEKTDEFNDFKHNAEAQYNDTVRQYEEQLQTVNTRLSDYQNLLHKYVKYPGQEECSRIEQGSQTNGRIISLNGETEEIMNGGMTDKNADLLVDFDLLIQLYPNLVQLIHIAPVRARNLTSLLQKYLDSVEQPEKVDVSNSPIKPECLVKSANTSFNDVESTMTTDERTEIVETFGEMLVRLGETVDDLKELGQPSDDVLAGDSGDGDLLERIQALVVCKLIKPFICLVQSVSAVLSRSRVRLDLEELENKIIETQLDFEEQLSCLRGYQDLKQKLFDAESQLKNMADARDDSDRKIAEMSEKVKRQQSEIDAFDHANKALKWSVETESLRANGIKNDFDTFREQSSTQISSMANEKLDKDQECGRLKVEAQRTETTITDLHQQVGDLEMKLADMKHENDQLKNVNEVTRTSFEDVHVEAKNMIQSLRSLLQERNDQLTLLENSERNWLRQREDFEKQLADEGGRAAVKEEESKLKLKSAYKRIEKLNDKLLENEGNLMEMRQFERNYEFWKNKYEEEYKKSQSLSANFAANEMVRNRSVTERQLLSLREQKVFLISRLDLIRWRELQTNRMLTGKFGPDWQECVRATSPRKNRFRVAAIRILFVIFLRKRSFLPASGKNELSRNQFASNSRPHRDSNNHMLNVDSLNGNLIRDRHQNAINNQGSPTSSISYDFNDPLADLSHIPIRLPPDL